MSRLAGAVVLAAASVAIAAPAFATKGPDHKELICHPVNGAGQTGTGWTLVDVDKASSHFDKDGNPKHQSHDGRVDVYAVSGACPVVPSTPTPTTPKPTKTETPCPTTTTPSASQTQTASPTWTSPSPSQTSSTPTTTDPATTTSPSVSVPRPTSTSPTASSASPSKRTTSSPRRSVPSSTVAPPEELARTGFDWVTVFAAALLLLVGALFHAAGRLARRGGRH